MVASSYDDSLKRLLVHEGGYTNHPSDPGGPTNFGITIHDARKYWKANATAADVRTMPLEVAKAIYRAKYWKAMRCDELPAGVDYAIFDYAVNSGTGRAPKVLQRVLHLPVTGRMDDTTVRAAQARDARSLVAAICDERLRFLQGLRTWPTFGKGWGRRVREVRAAALVMAERKPVQDTPASGPAVGKGRAPVNGAGQKGTAGGIVAGGAAAAQQAHESGARPAVIAVIVVVTIALAVSGWLFWRWRAQQEQEAEA